MVYFKSGQNQLKNDMIDSAIIFTIFVRLVGQNCYNYSSIAEAITFSFKFYHHSEEDKAIMIGQTSLAMI
jgi:hypothetical protein